MDIRTRTAGDEEDIRFFERLSFESYKLEFLRGREITKEEARRKFEEFEKADPLNPWGADHQVLLAANEEDTLMGLIWLAKKEPFYVFKERLVWIYNLHVVPEYRRKGVARHLLGEAEKWARMEWLRSIGLHVIAFNEPARCLYESLGYELVATHIDSCFYEKRIET
jgi:ribosomal protein S18 acetylase RimI-like enzyme